MWWSFKFCILSYYYKKWSLLIIGASHIWCLEIKFWLFLNFCVYSYHSKIYLKVACLIDLCFVSFQNVVFSLFCLDFFSEKVNQIIYRFKWLFLEKVYVYLYLGNKVFLPYGVKNFQVYFMWVFTWLYSRDGPATSLKDALGY